MIQTNITLIQFILKTGHLLSYQHSAPKYSITYTLAGNNIRKIPYNPSLFQPYSIFHRSSRERQRYFQNQDVNKGLDEIAMGHQNIIGVVHSVYTREDQRKQIINGIKQLFISYKIVDAKIYSCVFIQYALSLYKEQNERYNEQVVIKGRFFNQNTGGYRNNNKSCQSQFYSSIHDENGLYRKNKHQCITISENSPGYEVIDRKFHNPKVNTYKKQTQKKTEQICREYEQIRIEQESNKPINYKPLSEIQRQNYKQEYVRDSLEISDRSKQLYYPDKYNQVQYSEKQQFSPSSRKIILSKYSPQIQFMKPTRHNFQINQFHYPRKQMQTLKNDPYEFSQNFYNSRQSDDKYQYDASASQQLINSRGIQNQIDPDSIHQQSTQMKKKRGIILSQQYQSKQQDVHKLVIHELSGSKSKSKKINNQRQSIQNQYKINQSPKRLNKFMQPSAKNSQQFSLELHQVKQNKKMDKEQIDKYESWKKMVQHNQKFKLKMLNHPNPKQNVNIIRVTAPQAKGRHYNCSNI